MSHDLNPAQRDAVSTLSGPLLVLAGAGTGKTRVVTFRIANLIRHGTRPGQILAVTFTNKAAQEMQERAGALLGKRSEEKPEISTFHSLCVRVLRRNAKQLGYPEKFAIYDRGDQESAARDALREIRVPAESLRPGDLIQEISRWKMASIRPKEAAAVASTDKQHLAAMAYRRYQESLKNAGAMDFDDLLLCTEELLGQFPEVRNAEAARFRHVLVDEYQDTNGSQYRIIKALAAGHRNLCVVGDDDQSIYGWRGAEVTHILGFHRDWPDAKIVRLEENYRSIAPIIELANRLIAFNRVRHAKVLRAMRLEGEPPRVLQHEDEAIEAEQTVGEIAALLGARSIQPRDVAILFRTNEQPRAFEAELRRLKLPYVLVGGMSFYDRREVRDILAYLKAIAQPRDEVSLLRVLNTPPRGIGPKAAEMLVARAVAEGKPIGELLGEAESIEGLPAPAIEGCRQLDELLRAARDRFERQPLADVARDLIQHIRYQDEIDRLHKEPADRMSRWAAVEEVINSLAAYQKRARKPTLGGFLEDVALGGRDDSSDKDTQLQRNAIVLMTLHAAKGLEFPHVYLVGLEEGLLPHHRSVAADGPAIDEERRLCYVGVTRARDRLTLSLSLSRMKWGKPRPTIPSRFLFELMGKADNPQAIAALRAAREQHGGMGESPQPKGKPKGKSAARPKGSRTTKRPSGKRPRPKGR